MRRRQAATSAAGVGSGRALAGAAFGIFVVVIDFFAAFVIFEKRPLLFSLDYYS
jgi:hypothetical protein